MLHPNRSQVEKDTTKAGFTKGERINGPFSVKPEHATIVQYDSNRELGQI